MEIPEVNAKKLVDLLLDQRWHRECEMVPEWMPKFPDEKTRPKFAIKYPNEHSDVYLRYSAGPKQGFFWDIYPDDMQSVELAIIALSHAPIPLNYRKGEYPVVYKIPLE